MGDFTKIEMHYVQLVDHYKSNTIELGLETSNNCKLNANSTRLNQDIGQT